MDIATRFKLTFADRPELAALRHQAVLTRKTSRTCKQRSICSRKANTLPLEGMASSKFSMNPACQTSRFTIAFNNFMAGIAASGDSGCLVTTGLPVIFIKVPTVWNG